ncbi:MULTISPECIES: baseplate multidomain protein megatron [unclassified Yoonia]|uniref:baseplate multidomain protein megatron n=1 Tax=unclassified Yoonia TaxID=2629118 RepID=UPI002AFE9F27|nr:MULTISPECIES: glycoside hydrolase/phage tail family protein [unclassified Yoonia]
MATLVLGVVGTAVGGSIGGSFLGVSAAAIGGFIGSSIGAGINSWLIAPSTPNQTFEGARLDALRITSSTEGAVVPQLFGRMRIGGNIIWATDFVESVNTTSETIGGGGKGGGGGGGGTITTTEYLYSASFAVALCEGPVTGIGRIWADGKPMDMAGVTWRWYPGDETQAPDTFIRAKMGAMTTPAYRGLAYVVFENLALSAYGNRLPQISFEVFRPLVDQGCAEGMIGAVAMIPASGEFAYATQIIRKTDGTTTTAENAHALAGEADFVVSVDRLRAQAPAVKIVSLVVSWFGTDLRADQCQLRPGVEVRNKTTTPQSWSVNGTLRTVTGYLVSQQAPGRPSYGGTPADFSVVQAIHELKARGLRVTFYPFVLMDVAPGNTRPNPYSDNASQIGQPAFPWRGRITCSPAPGYAGTVDKTAAAAAQVAEFFGTARVEQFLVSGTKVIWQGGWEWGLRRMVLHYALLCKAAGGVDAFVIGSELRGLTQIRSAAGVYPAVELMRVLAADVRTILGPGTKISYAADWSEYFGHQPQDGSGDLAFHLDPFWADPNVDFIGIDNYMPLSDWRDGNDHRDAAQWPAIYDRDYLQSHITGGEGFDWFYADDADRAEQTRTPITDGAYGKPWVYRFKDLASWWSNPHVNRIGGVESGTPTVWVPQSKPFWFTEFGCPAIDRGTNQPNVFVDAKSSETAVPHHSRGWRDDAIQRAYLEATLSYWSDPAHNPVSGIYGPRMVNVAECAAWTWDARPYPFFPHQKNIWSDGGNWRLGHWLAGRLGSVSLQSLVRALCLRAGMPSSQIDVSGLWGAVEGYVITSLEAPRASITTLARHFGYDAVESEGVLRFVMRGGRPVTTFSYDDLVVTGSADAEPFELTRAQETELPQALKWQLARSDEDYDAAMVEARRITVSSTRIAADMFPFAVPPEEADRRCRRALMEAWVGRETAALRLPPSQLALDPGDVLALQHDGRLVDIRVLSIADNEARTISGILQDAAIYDLPPGQPRASTLAAPVVFGGTQVVFLDLPQLTDADTAHQPLIAATARPWPGTIAVWRSASADAFALFQTFGSRARIGTLIESFDTGPVSRFDLSNALVVDMGSSALESVTDLALFGGANAFAVESAPGTWEIVQAGRAELIGTGQYRLTRLLRGQRGTEYAIANMVPAGARVVVLDAALARMPVAQSDLGLPWNWRIGPASLPFTDDSYVDQSFTPASVGLRQFAVAHVAQPRMIGRVPGDLILRWTRRDRALVADSWAAVEVPQSEAIEAYEVDIMDGVTRKRVLATGTTSVVYASADQVADFGRLLGPGDTLTIRIAQLSALLGRGAMRAVTLHF